MPSAVWFWIQTLRAWRRPAYTPFICMEKNVFGEPAEYYKDVIIYGPEGDLDGDGIADTQDPCLFVEPAGVDADRDGRDDACDMFIGAETGAPEASVTPSGNTGAIGSAPSAATLVLATAPAGGSSVPRNGAVGSASAAGKQTSFDTKTQDGKVLAGNMSASKPELARLTATGGILANKTAYAIALAAAEVVLLAAAGFKKRRK